MADSPVTAYRVVTTPAATVMGAIAERMKVQDGRDPETVLGQGGRLGGGGEGGRGHLGRSRMGLRSKKPTGRRVKPQVTTGMTGQSSGRGKCVIPKVCHRTMSAPSMSRSAAT